MNIRYPFRFLLGVCFLITLQTSAQEKAIQEIRNQYYEKAAFDTIKVSSKKVVPGMGEQEVVTLFIHLDCRSMECEDATIDRVALRKVSLSKAINTSAIKTEFLFSNSGALIFYFRKISSEDYFHQTGRECAEERYYLEDKQLLQVRISPCKGSETFESIELTEDIPFILEEQKNSFLSEAQTHSEIFQLLIAAEH